MLDIYLKPEEILEADDYFEDVPSVQRIANKAADNAA